MKFPEVSGSSLSRRKYYLPEDFEGKYNLVLIPFQQHQQQAVDTWVDFARQLEIDFPGVHTYELPTIQKMNTLVQTFINEGMRAGIPDQGVRDRVITLYLDKLQFRHSLGIPDENDIFVYLVDKSGNILWRNNGKLTTDKKASLLHTLDAVTSTNIKTPVLSAEYV